MRGRDHAARGASGRELVLLQIRDTDIAVAEHTRNFLGVFGVAQLLAAVALESDPRVA